MAIRRYFERALRQTARRGVPYAVVILDLDWFKRINDTFGHRTGDLVLQDLATVLKGTLRAMDVAARFGGEEFVILLPSASSPEAAAVAERLRRQVEAKRLTIEGQMVRYTASFGSGGQRRLVGWSRRHGRGLEGRCGAVGGEARRSEFRRSPTRLWCTTADPNRSLEERLTGLEAACTVGCDPLVRFAGRAGSRR